MNRIRIGIFLNHEIFDFQTRKRKPKGSKSQSTTSSRSALATAALNTSMSTVKMPSTPIKLEQNMATIKLEHGSLGE